MARQTHSQARRLAEDVQEDTKRFETFLLGYVHGAQDQYHDADLGTDEEFRKRMKELYRNEYSDTYL